MGRKALLVIDMLNDFMSPDGALFCGAQSRRIIPAVCSLLEEHRAAGSLVIFVQDSHQPDDREFELFPPHCLTGEWGSELIAELVPLPEEQLLPKTRYSAFFGTNLESILAEACVEEVHLCGVCTSICVMDSCSDLRNRDYKVLLHVSGVADFDLKAHEFAITRMKNVLGAELV